MPSGIVRVLGLFASVVARSRSHVYPHTGTDADLEHGVLGKRWLAMSIGASFLRAGLAAFLIVTLGILASSQSTTAQFGPLLAVYVDPSTATPGEWVGVTVIANGTGSYVRITVNVPTELTIGNDLRCTHKTLYCDNVSATGGLVTADARADPFAGGPMRVTVSFSVQVPASAVPGTQYDIHASMDGLFSVLQPDLGTGAQASAAITVGGVAVPQARPTPRPTPTPKPATPLEDDGPSIRITKMVCENTTLPVFGESHCSDDPGAVFELLSPQLSLVATLTSGERYHPTGDQFAQGDMWRVVDVNASSTYAPVTVLSCLEHRPGQSVMLGVAPVGNLRGLERWDVWWTRAHLGDGQQAMPSLECVWFELPNLTVVPAVLSLQALTSDEPYLSWTDPEQGGLGEVARGDSGDDLEVEMSLSNLITNEVYTFVADAYGHVLVPAGDYVLQSADTGNEALLHLYPGVTALAEIGIGAGSAM